MNAFKVIFGVGLAVPLLIGCVKKVGDDTFSDSTRTVASTTTTTTVSAPSATATASNFPVTLPVLDAFFADSGFAGDLERNAGLSPEEVAKVRDIARKGTAGMRSTDTGSTYRSRMETLQKLSSAIGQDKANKVVAYVQTRWNGSSSNAMTEKPNVIPSDTRIVVNIPEFRMDLFDGGQLVRSYKVAIGYPEFPLPVGLRSASSIIFNPPWTTPDEPWVQASKKVTVGETVEPGDKLNPLGIMKVPIGLPSLIHGGKTSAQIGNFGSHGCVGLTNNEAKDFVKQLARMTGDSLSDQDITEYTKDKNSSKEIKLPHSVPVELRYESIVLENGKLHIMRDVYDRNTTTDSMLNAVLQTYGTSLDRLNASEQSQLQQAIQSMARDANGNQADGAGTGVMQSTMQTRDTVGQKVPITKSVKGAKEIDIPIAELAGKGYPEMTKQSGSTVSSQRRR